MKLMGVINGNPIVVMIDSGATHCFVAHEVAAKLELVIDETSILPVRLGDGKDTQTAGLCSQVIMTLGNVEFELAAYVFPVTRVDLILGVTWLAMLGEVTANWAEMTMSFTFKGRQIALKGDPRLAFRQISAFEKLSKEEIDGAWLEWAMEITNLESEIEEAIPEDVQELLTEFKGVTTPLDGLLPRQENDHHIPLQPGAAPVSVRPYRYSSVQKNEIEKMVEELLKAGLIQHSSSPYASPVLLVHKKDGSWRFCVDYCELNKRTVLDNYPIPVIQELLDELHGVSWFTRLDLKSRYHQIRMAEEDIAKTGFHTHSGHYEFVVMPFGLRNAPSTFQAIMNDLFRPLLQKFVTS